MSGIGAWIWGTSQLDDAVDKATSELLPAGAEDIALNLEICDQIRSKSVPAKDAMRALKRRLNHKNPNVQLLALGLTDICIKNGGDHFLVEVASREFVDNLVSILKVPVLNLEVKNVILRLIQNWSFAFEGKHTLSYMGQVYKMLTNEGFNFPPKDLAVANSAMVDTQTAPEWIDSEVCLRCRTAFTFTNRKHHCRNCGQVFDQQCSSKSMPLPHFGITTDVRVCDGCHAKLTKKHEKVDKGHRHSTSLHGTRHRGARELADAELQRAIQLSLQEVNANGNARPGYVPSQPKWQSSEPPIIDRSSYPDRKALSDEDDDPDLKAAIEASLREANAPKPSAPIVVETPRTEAPYEYAGPGYSQSYPPGLHQPALPKVPSYDLEPLEEDAILTFNQTVEQVQAQGGRDISRYPAVNELYDKANGLRPKMALSLDDAGRKEEMLSDMHDKLSQAVKLYDQILTQQISHPRWRSSAAPPSQYQQPVSSYNTGYNQWTPAQLQQPPSGYQQPETQQPLSPQMTAYSPPLAQEQPQQAQYVSSPRFEVSQPQWRPQQPQQQQQQSQSTSWYTPPQQTQSPVASAPPSQQPSAPPSFQHSPQQPQQQQPSQYQPYFATPPTPSTSQTLPPVTYNTPSALSQPPQQIIDSHPQAAPLQTHPSQSIARHNTITYAQSAAQPQLARSNTVAAQQPTIHARPQQQQQQHVPQRQLQYQHQQQPYQQAMSPPPAPAALPQFPVAPTLAPQAFPMFGATLAAPSGIEYKEERKEALLIDL